MLAAAVLDDLLTLPRWLVELVFVVYVATITGFVLLERRKPAATLAWLLVLVFLPLFGTLAYLAFGRQRVRRRRRRRRKRGFNPTDTTRKMANVEHLPTSLSPSSRGLVRLALETSAAPLRRADHVELMASPDTSLEALEQAIRNARRTIHMEFYIWNDDEISQRVTALLTQRAQAGVRVRIIYDHWGSIGLDGNHFSELRQAGGRIVAYGRLLLPIRFARSRANFRNHRKIVIVDQSVGFMGGINMANDYLGSGQHARWRDLLVKLEGDAVLGLEATFAEDWLESTDERIDLQPEQLELDIDTPLVVPTPMSSAGPLVQIIPSGPDLELGSSIVAQFLAAIMSAQDRCYIATPYFILDEVLTIAVKTAAMRGVDVRVLIPDPSKSDAKLVAWASRSYYDELQEAGCRIFEYLPGMFHAKYMVVDDGLSAIGSANMDIRSFYLNYEVTAMFYDRQVTADLAELFQADQLRSREITPDIRQNMPLGARLGEGFARLLSPLL